MNNKIISILLFALIINGNQLAAMSKTGKNVDFKALRSSCIDDSDEELSSGLDEHIQEIPDGSDFGYPYDADEEIKICRAFNSGCSSTVQSPRENINHDGRSSATRSTTPRPTSTSFLRLGNSSRASSSLRTVSELSFATTHEDVSSPRSDSAMSDDSSTTNRSSSQLKQNIENQSHNDHVGHVVKNARYEETMMKMMQGDTELTSSLGKRKRNKNDQALREDA